MWKKGIICGLFMLLLLFVPVVSVRAQGQLKEETLDSKQGLSQSLLNAEEFPQTSGKLAITENTCYKYTAKQTMLMRLWTENLSSGNIPRVEVYDELGRKTMIIEKDRTASDNNISEYLYIQKGDTCYFKIGWRGDKAQEYTLGYRFSESASAGIKSVTVLQYPVLYGYKEWYSNYDKIYKTPYYEPDDDYRYGFYDSILNDLIIQVEWEDGTVTTEAYKKGWKYYTDIQFEQEGTYTIFVCYMGRLIELPYTIKSLENMKTETAILQKSIDLEYSKGEWKGFTFTPEESGYYDINYASTGKFSILLMSPEQGAISGRREWGYEVSFNLNNRIGSNYLVEGKTYYLYAGSEAVGGKLRLKIRKAGEQQKYSDIVVEKMESVSYTGSPQEPKPVIFCNGVDITTKNWQKEYKYYYNKEPGTALVITKFGYHEENSWNERVVYTTFVIRQPIAEAEVIIPEYSYTGKAILPEAEVKVKGRILEMDKDYTISAADNVESGTASVTITGIGKYEGSITRTFAIKPLQRTIEVSDTLIKNKKSKAFKLGAKSDGKLTYSSSNKKVAKVNAKGKVTIKDYGTAVIGIKAAGDRNHAEGQASVKLVVTSKAGKIKSVKRSSGGKVTVKLQKTADAHGYEVSYSTDKDFAQNVRKQTTKKTAVVLKNLKKKTTYYVRVRSYRKVKGKKLYSDYSKVKTVN